MGNSVKNTSVATANELNNKGASLMYVLMALVFVGAIAMLVLNSSRKETIDSSLRASSEMARYAATSGLTLAATTLTNPEATLPGQGTTTSQQFITALFNDPNGANRWVVGEDGNSANAFQADGNGGRYRVRVMNIDFSQTGPVSELVAGVPQLRQGRNVRNSPIVVQLESEVIDASGSRSRNIGVYELFGYETQGGAEVQVPTNALYMGSGIDEINIPITVFSWSRRRYMASRPYF